jgi:hypothetical protein
MERPFTLRPSSFHVGPRGAITKICRPWLSRNNIRSQSPRICRHSARRCAGVRPAKRCPRSASNRRHRTIRIYYKAIWRGSSLCARINVSLLSYGGIPLLANRRIALLSDALRNDSVGRCPNLSTVGWRHNRRICCRTDSGRTRRNGRCTRRDCRRSRTYRGATTLRRSALRWNCCRTASWRSCRSQASRARCSCA